MRKLFYVFIAAAIIGSCKKAIPERSSEEANRKEAEKKRNLLKAYRLFEYINGWNVVLTGEAIGFSMTIDLYKDHTFIKTMQSGAATGQLTGSYKDSSAGTLHFTILEYAEARLPGATGPLWDWISDKREVLLHAHTSDTIVSGAMAADGRLYRYARQ